MNTNPKCFWTHMKSLSKRTTIPNNIIHDNKTSTQGHDFCDLFTKYFQPHFYAILTHHLICPL